MKVNVNKARAYAFVLLIFALFSAADAQKRSKTRRAKPVAESLTNPVLWEPVDAQALDLYLGPGGSEMQPDLSSVTFVKEEKQGHNKKYRIRDARGMEWVAKLGRESQPETAAVRLLYGLGYKTEINYLAPTITIPGKGTFQNVRLEARPEGVKRLDEWKWKSNPFVGSNELQGLKIMMAFLTNWDLLDLQNQVLRVETNGRVEHQFIISDLGATYGKLGTNNLPIFFRLGRKTNSPRTWSKARFIKRVQGNRIVFAFKGKNRGLMNDITVENGRWLLSRLTQLSDSQLRDIYRAANYSPTDVDILAQASQRRVRELAEAVGRGGLASK